MRYLICSYVEEGVVFAGLVSLTSLEIVVPGGGVGVTCFQGFDMFA